MIKDARDWQVAREQNMPHLQRTWDWDPSHLGPFSRIRSHPPPKKLTKPHTPPDHAISLLSAEFRQAFLDNDPVEIQTVLTMYELHLKTSSLDFIRYNQTKLSKLAKAAMKLFAPKSQPPPAPTTQPLLHLPNPQTVSMKLPQAEPTKWTGFSYDFYPWIPSNTKMFEQFKWDDAAKTQGMLQTMPIDKQSSFVQIDNRKESKKKLICDFLQHSCFPTRSPQTIQPTRSTLADSQRTCQPICPCNQHAEIPHQMHGSLPWPCSPLHQHTVLHPQRHHNQL